MRLSGVVDISKLTRFSREHLRKRNGSDHKRIATASDAEGDFGTRSIEATEYSVDAAAGFIAIIRHREIGAHHVMRMDLHDRVVYRRGTHSATGGLLRAPVAAPRFIQLRLDQPVRSRRADNDLALGRLSGNDGQKDLAWHRRASSLDDQAPQCLRYSTLGERD